MSRDEDSPVDSWAACLPCPEAAKEKTTLSGSQGSCSSLPMCSLTALGDLKAAGLLEILLKSESSCQTEVSQALSLQQPGTWSSVQECGHPNQGAWTQPEEAKNRKWTYLRWVISTRQWPRAYLDAFGAQEREKATPQSKANWRWPDKSLPRLQQWRLHVNIPFGCFTEFSRRVLHWGWNMRENRMFQVTKNEHSNSFTGLWVAKKVYLIMGERLNIAQGIKKELIQLTK